MSDERYDAGMEVRREVLGDAHVDRAEAGKDAFTEDFQALITRYAWGEIWSRPGLDRRTRITTSVAPESLADRSREPEDEVGLQDVVFDDLLPLHDDGGCTVRRDEREVLFDQGEDVLGVLRRGAEPGRDRHARRARDLPFGEDAVADGADEVGRAVVDQLLRDLRGLGEVVPHVDRLELERPAEHAAGPVHLVDGKQRRIHHRPFADRHGARERVEHPHPDRIARLTGSRTSIPGCAGRT